MSQTLDYYFNYDAELNGLADWFHGEIGANLSPCDPTATYYCGQLFGMDFYLGTHDLENDMGIPFENYRYCAGLKTFVPNGDLRPLQVAVMIAMPHLLFRRLGISGILVFDAQQLIAGYEARTDENGIATLYDSVSASFVRLPSHWRELSSRIPPRAFTTDAETSAAGYLRSIGRDVRDIN
jgi:hypothetical protein